MIDEFCIISEFITLSRLEKKLKDRHPEDLFIDVRTAEEFMKGHIPGFINLPVGQLREQLESCAYKNIYLCSKGQTRAKYVAEMMCNKGQAKSITEVKGGLLAWELSGLPIEKGVPTKAKESGPDARNLLGHVSDTYWSAEHKFAELSAIRQMYLIMGIWLLFSTIISGPMSVLLNIVMICIFISSAITGQMFAVDLIKKAPWNKAH